MDRIIEHTADGSNTLYIPEIDEHYHSVKGAETESQHVFIDMGMKEASKSKLLNILEIGFGTGLNAYLSLKEAVRTKQEVRYTGIELYPLLWETVEQLRYTDDPIFRELHTAPWNTDCEIIPGFTLYKQQADLTQMQPGDKSRFDVVYFDAFAPEKQPEMWEERIFDSLYNIMSDGGILTTYCAKGVVRRTLQQSGFIVERIPGPPGGKREILRARK